MFLQAIPQTIFDAKPDEWINLGTTTENGTVITQTFDELWTMYQFPDRGDVIENNMIIQVIYITYDVYVV